MDKTALTGLCAEDMARIIVNVLEQRRPGELDSYEERVKWVQVGLEKYAETSVHRVMGHALNSGDGSYRP